METPARSGQLRVNDTTPAKKPLRQNGAALSAPEPKVVPLAQPVYYPERAYYPTEKRRDLSGCRLPSLRCLGCSGCLLFIALFVFIIYVIVARPATVWNPVKQWMNAELTPIEHTVIQPAAVYVDLQSQLSRFTVGRNTWVITEDQLRAMVSDRVKGVKMEDLSVDIQEGLLKLYWNGDAGTSVPLWYVIEVQINDKGLPYFSKIGTERLGTPSFMNSLLTDMFLNAIQVGTNQKPDQLVNVLVPLPNNVTVSGVTFEEDKMEIEINVSTGLENLFDQ